jgi:CheY-like chemotaxis protein
MLTTRDPHPVRVAVADDSTIFRTSLVRFLATLPHIKVVAEAINGQEALQIVEKKTPDILILDIQMPVMDGLAVLRHLRRMETNVQVLVLSAHSGAYSEQVMESGATLFVPKGDIPRLLKALSQLIDERNKS